MGEQHQRFLGRLRASSDAVFAVGRWLHDNGRTIEIPPVSFAPTAADHADFVDYGDIIEIGGAGRRVVQVKQIKRDFRSAEDWPFREVFVSNVGSVERLADVAAYVTLSHDMKAAAIVRGETKPHWYVTEKLARNTGNREKFYACPTRFAEFRLLRRNQ